MPDVVAVLIGGTFVTELVARSYYRAAAHQFGQAHTMGLPHAGTRSLNQAADQINHELDRRFPGCLIAALCHSQAGLVVSQSALANANIVQVVAAGSPFHGTNVARLGSPLYGTPLGRVAHTHLRSTDDMMPGSQYLTRLRSRLPELTAAGRLATVAFYRDWVVPWHSSHVCDARNYVCCTREEYREVTRRFPGSHHVQTTRRPGRGGHILGLQLAEQELTSLFKTLWQHAVDAALATIPPTTSPEAA